MLSDIKGVKNFSDDIIVYGATKAEHDASLMAVINRLSENGLTINKDKTVLNKTELSFFGHIFSSRGVSLDPARIKALDQMKPPTNVTEVRSLLGLFAFNSRHIYDFSALTAPLRQLTKTGTRWQWTSVEQQAFDTLKACLRENIVTAYFDPKRRSQITVDASIFGLAAILCQPDDNGVMRPITYISRSLTDVESRYNQTELEALSCVWACEKLHRQIFMSEFDLLTDHRALEVLFGNPRAKLSARLERWRLRLSAYTYRIKYRPGRDNPADYFSRHPIASSASGSRWQKVADEYINFIVDNAVPKAMNADEIRSATENDPTMQRLMKHIHDDDWHNAANDSLLKPYYNVRHELIVSSDGKLILRGTRIVIPESLQRRAIQLAHEGHQGIVKTKMLLREKVWFANIDKMAADMLSNCIACAATTPQNHKEPLMMSPLPQSAWQQLSLDFCGPLPTGEMLMVLIDDYSRYPIVEVIHSTSANTVITALDRVLSMFSTPTEIRTDNGPPFNSLQFKQYAN